MKHIIILTSESALTLAQTIEQSLIGSAIYSKHKLTGVTSMNALEDIVEFGFNEADSLIFIGAIGICVRLIAPHIQDKYTDPAVLCMDSTGKNIVSLLSGHEIGRASCRERV